MFGHCIQPATLEPALDHYLSLPLHEGEKHSAGYPVVHVAAVGPRHASQKTYYNVLSCSYDTWHDYIYIVIYFKCMATT